MTRGAEIKAKRRAGKNGSHRLPAFIGSIITTFIIAVFFAPLFGGPKSVGANLIEANLIGAKRVRANPIQNLEIPVKRQESQPQRPSAAQSQPPTKKPEIPDQWTMQEIEKARTSCAPILSAANAEFEIIDPIRKGRCGTPAPIKLKALGTGVRVKISPPASLNCNMVRALNLWLEEKVQPLAKASFGAPVIEIKNISSYACRHRYNNPKKRLSEHALANALDIAGLKIANGKYVSLLKHWGETKRDRKRTIARAQQKAEAEAQARAKAQAKTRELARAKLQAGAKIKIEAGTETGAKTVTASHPNNGPAHLGAKPGRKSRPWNASLKVVVPPAAPLDDRARFLRKLHKDACGIFGTVLGPEANEAHRNHYHFDLAPRRRSAYCQ